MSNIFGHSYKGFYGKWSWDWDLVAHLDPDYAKKYLQTTPFIAPMPNEDNWREELRRLRAEQRMTEQQINTAQCGGEVDVPAMPVNAYGRAISESELSEEDKSIMNLMHTQDDAPRPIPRELREFRIERVPIAVPQPAPPAAQINEIMGFDEDRTTDPEPEFESEVYYVNGQRTTKRRERVKAKSNYRNGNWYSGEAQYKVSKINPPMPTVPLLAPPKVFLAEGSSYRYTDSAFEYTVARHELLDDHAVFTGNGFLESEAHIKVFTYRVILNRVFNSHKHGGTGKVRIVFNKKTGNLYVIYNELKDKTQKKGRTFRRLLSLSTQIGLVQMLSMNLDPHQVLLFTRALRRVVRDKIGAEPATLYSLEKDSSRHEIRDHMAQEIFALLWQWKAGQALPWITPAFMSTIHQLRASWQHYLKDDSYGSQFIEFPKMERPIGKGFFKALRKSPHPSTIMKFTLGVFYTNTTYKMVTRMPHTHLYYNICTVLDVVYHNKRLQHLMAKLVNDPSENALQVITSLSDGACDVYRDRDEGVTKSYFVRYVKAMEQIYVKNEWRGRLISWELFRDTLRMADEYHISINANRLTNPEVIQDLHHTLIQFTNRDQRFGRELSGVEFIPFVHPDKEYNGFTFKFLKDQDDLSEEGKMMKHCVGGYGYRCIGGNSVIFSMRQGDQGCVTLEIDGNQPGCRILQKYTRHDLTITNPEILGIIEQWRTDIAKLHQNQPPYAQQCDVVSKFVKTLALIKAGLVNDKGCSVEEDITAPAKLIKEWGLTDYVNSMVGKSASLFSSKREGAKDVDAIMGQINRLTQQIDAPVPVEQTHGASTFDNIRAVARQVEVDDATEER